MIFTEFSTLDKSSIILSGEDEEEDDDDDDDEDDEDEPIHTQTRIKLLHKTHIFLVLKICNVLVDMIPLDRIFGEEKSSTDIGELLLDAEK